VRWRRHVLAQDQKSELQPDGRPKRQRSLRDRRNCRRAIAASPVANSSTVEGSGIGSALPNTYSRRLTCHRPAGLVDGVRNAVTSLPPFYRRGRSDVHRWCPNDGDLLEHSTATTIPSSCCVSHDPNVKAHRQPPFESIYKMHGTTNRAVISAMAKMTSVTVSSNSESRRPIVVERIPR
jgi:hypothetical protein